MLKKYDVIQQCSVSHFVSHLRIKSIPRPALGKVSKGEKMTQNISQTPIKPRFGAVENKIAVLFICHGNICRSTMAQYVFQNLINRHNLTDQFYIDSAATSREEIGNPVHHGTRRKLKEVGIPCGDHRARQLEKREYDEFDYLIGMDSMNIRNMMRILGGDPKGKVSKLLDFTERTGQDIADPWYTGNFDRTYEDVKEGCEALLQDCLLRL